MSDPTARPTGIYATRHAPKTPDPNRVLPHMRKLAQTPAAKAATIKTEPGVDGSSTTPTQPTRAKLELNPRTAEFSPATIKSAKSGGLLAPSPEATSPVTLPRSPGPSTSLQVQMQAMADRQREVVAGMEDEIVEKKDEVIVLRKNGNELREDLVVMNQAWRIVDDMARRY